MTGWPLYTLLRGLHGLAGFRIFQFFLVCFQPDGVFTCRQQEVNHRTQRSRRTATRQRTKNGTPAFHHLAALAHAPAAGAVEAGIYRLNQVKNPEAIKVACTAKEKENQLPRTFVDYEENPASTS